MKSYSGIVFTRMCVFPSSELWKMLGIFITSCNIFMLLCHQISRYFFSCPDLTCTLKLRNVFCLSINVTQFDIIVYHRNLVYAANTSVQLKASKFFIICATVTFWRPGFKEFDDFKSSVGYIGGSIFVHNYI